MTKTTEKKTVTEKRWAYTIGSRTVAATIADTRKECDRAVLVWASPWSIPKLNANGYRRVRITITYEAP